MAAYDVVKVQTRESFLPIEIEVYLNPDGSVTFADLAEAAIPIVHKLNPDQSLVCELPAPDSPDDGRES